MGFNSAFKGLKTLLQMHWLFSCSEWSYVLGNNPTGLSYHGIHLRQENLGNLRRFRYAASPADVRKIPWRRKQQRSSQMASYQTTRGHIPEGSNLPSHTAGNPKPHTIFVFPSQRKLKFHANYSYNKITSTNPRQFD